MLKKTIFLVFCILLITIPYQLIIYGDDYNIKDKKSIGYIEDETYFYLLNNGYLYISGINFEKSYGNPYIRENPVYREYINNGKPLKIMESVKEIVTDNLEERIFAIKEDNSLWAMGTNIFGDYIESDYRNSLIEDFTTKTPYFVKIMDNVKYVSCTDHTVYIIKTDNTLWGYGNNRKGQILNGDTFIFEPVKILDSADDIENIYSHEATFILKKDGSLWSMGKNEYGQLGVGDKNPRWEPTKILDNINHLKFYDSRIYAISNDNKLYQWYYNAGRMYEYDRDDEEYLKYKNAEQLTPLKLTDKLKKFSFFEFGNRDYVLDTDGKLLIKGIFTYIEDGYYKYIYDSILLDDICDFTNNIKSLYILKNDSKTYVYNEAVDILKGKYLETGYKISDFEKENNSDYNNYPAVDFENSKTLAVPSEINILFNETKIDFNTYYINGGDYINISDFIDKINKLGFNISLKIDESFEGDLSDDFFEKGSFQKKRYNSFCVKENKNKVYIDDKQISSQIFYINDIYCCKIQDLLECLNFNVIWNDISHCYEINTNKVFETTENLYRIPDIIDYYDVYTLKAVSDLEHWNKSFLRMEEQNLKYDEYNINIFKDELNDYNFYVEKYKNNVNPDIYDKFKNWYNKFTIILYQYKY